MGLTFSTFIDNFYAEEHITDEFSDRVKALYESVKAILNVADEQADRLCDH